MVFTSKDGFTLGQIVRRKYFVGDVCEMFEGEHAVITDFPNEDNFKIRGAVVWNPKFRDTPYGKNRIIVDQWKITHTVFKKWSQVKP